MRFSIDAADLAKALQPAAHIATNRASFAATGGVMVRAERDSVVLSATDLEVSISLEVGCEVLEGGSALVPGRLMLDVIKSAPAGKIDCLLTDEGQLFNVAWGTGGAKLRTLRVEDFPSLSTAMDGQVVALPAAALQLAIGQVSRAASRDETRPLLTGVLMRAGGAAIELVATDSYRLCVKRLKLQEQLPGELEATVPAHAMAELGRLIQQSDAERVDVALQGHQITFKLDATILSSRLLDGHFPDYHQLLPESPTVQLELGSEEFGAAVRRVSLVAQKNAPLALGLEPGELRITTRTPDVGEASETLAAPFDGEPMQVGFNPQFLRDGMESVQSESLTLKLTSPVRPGVIESDEGGGSELIYLVMPVRLNE